MAALVRVNRTAAGIFLPSRDASVLRTSLIARTASAASSWLPCVGTITRLAIPMANVTIADAVPSRFTITNWLFVLAYLIWTVMVSSSTSAMTVSEAGFPGFFAQRETGLSGSASIKVTVAPLFASSVARSTADVDFPAPPLGLAKTMDGIWEPKVGG